MSETMMIAPQIPVGGRLKHFVQNWEQITDENWVLSILRTGLKIDFMEEPVFSGIKETRVPKHQMSLILSEVESLLEKGAIEKIPQNQKQEGFYSTFFLVTKKSGEMRPIINLKPLNKFVKKHHFKMDTLAKVLNLVKRGDYAISLDLKDAYLHVPIHMNHRKFLRFCVNGQCYQFTAMCFGPTQAPRVFTKLTAVVAAHLRMQNIRLSTYLDDWLSLEQQRAWLITNREKIIHLLIHLGFIINLKKSSLIPSTTFVYLGNLFKTKQGIVLPTQERIEKLHRAIHALIQGQNSAFHYLQLLGLMASCIEIVPYARLHMRPVQLHLLAHWSPASRNYLTQIRITPHLVKHLQWWLLPANMTKGRSLLPWCTTITLTTDASKTMYGGHVNNMIHQGTWSREESNLHINQLEMKAVFLSMKHFLPYLTNQSVLIRSDNIAVCQYINRMGGTKSPKLCYLTWDLWHLAIQNNIQLKAAHLSGRLNILADNLSRVKIRPTEWSLNNQVVQKLFHHWGHPMIDLFASIHNHKAPLFCTWTPHPQAMAIDALSISWERMMAYAFPPICLIPKVLQHMQQFQCQIILITPQWPRRHWYATLLQLSIAVPLKLPAIPNLLSQPNTSIHHPNPELFNLTAWLLSTEISKQKAFQKELEPYSQHPGDQELKKTILASSKSMIAGVVKGKKIPIQHL